MRTAIFTAILLLTFSALGAAGLHGAPPSAPPAPPPVTYDVWGFRWDGRQYVKQPANSLNTSDLKQAADYAAQLTSYAGWSVTTNMPEACVVHTMYHGPAISIARPTAFPDKPTFSVWAFRLTDGKWVKDDSYSWTTTDPVAGLDYAKQVSAVPGWVATDNCPPPVPQAERYVDGGTVHGAENYQNLPFQVCDVAYKPGPPAGYAQQITNWFGGSINLNLNALINNALRNGTVSYNTLSDDTGSFSTNYTPSPPYDNSSDIQNMLNTQQMIDTQNMINTQNMVNTQNMIDTQNMVNSMQANP